MNACSAGGQFEWGGGAAPAAQAGECVHEGTQLSQSYAVGTRPQCKSPSPGYAHVFDLSGNVEEWEDSCEKSADTGAFTDACRTRGGSFETPRDDTRCDAVPTSARQRSDVSPTLGFRCCDRAPL
jgi:formylglycine-generating enzyme